MTSRRDRKRTKAVASGPALESPKSNISQINNSLAKNIENEELVCRIDLLEELINNQANKENVEIQQLKDHIRKLEEQLKQNEIQIENLKDTVMHLQCHDSKDNGADAVISSDIKGNMADQSDVIIQSETNDRSVLLSDTNSTNNVAAQIKSEIITTSEIDLNFQKPKRNTIVKSESEQEKTNDKRTYESKNKSKIFDNDHSSTTLKSEINNSDQLRPTASNAQFHNTTKDEKMNKSKIDREYSASSSSEISTSNGKSINSTGRPNDSSMNVRSVGCGNFVFARWMNSRDIDKSIWLNKGYRKALLSYIGKIYGQKNNIDRVLGPLEIECNESDELDQLYDIIKVLEKQPDAKESLRQWRLQTRSNHRLEEFKNIFEYNSSPPDDWKITLTSTSEQIINRGSIKAYFDMICRDGLVTAEIGEYLDLNRKDIIGGTDYDSHNEKVTFVKVNLDKSTIDLVDNRVDLVTCFVTLHLVPHLQPILSEIVRILRPGGYLILREHDCKNERSIQKKYLNFVHASIMIARVGEFADPCANHENKNQDENKNNCKGDVIDWKQQKINIIKYTNLIQYRARKEWHQELETVGFRLKGTFEYSDKNPQALFYAIYQLHTK